MRTIDRAVLMQTIQRPSADASLRSDETKSGYCISDNYLEESARKLIMSRLSKYIVFQDKDRAYYIERFWYFDVDRYQKDLSAFGFDVRMAVNEPTVLPYS